MNARRLTSATLAVLCAVAGVLLFSSAPASAARGHVFGGMFGKSGAGASEFSEPQGVAVNEASGDVYVVDKGNDRVEYFNSTGTKLEGEFNGSGLLMNEGFKEAGSGGQPGEILTGQFSSPEGIAVDNSCHLHKPELTEATTPTTCAEFDPSDGDVYVVDAGHEAIDKFSATGEYIGQLTEGSPGVAFGKITGIAVNPAGELWVGYKAGESFAHDISNFNDERSNAFVETVEADIQAPAAELESGLAVDAEDNLYAHVGFAQYTEDAAVVTLNSKGKELGKAFETEEPVSGIAIEFPSDGVYVDNVETVARFSVDGSPVERFGSGHLTGGAGIGVDSSSGTVYVADSTADVVDVFPLEPPGPPTIESSSSTDVASTSATFDAEVDPRGASSEYSFEYGPCSALAVSSCAHSAYPGRVPVPGGSLGSGFNAVSVTAHMQDLAPHTTYHFRVVAHNELGPPVEGEEAVSVFTTQTIGGELVLPDGREWELVSPPDEHGAQLMGLAREALAQASASGEAVTYFTELSSTESDPQGSANGGQVLSTRRVGGGGGGTLPGGTQSSNQSSEGWSSKDIATPHSKPTEDPNGDRGFGEYYFFSEDFARALVEPQGPLTPFEPLTACSATGCTPETFPEATEYTPYLRHNTTCESQVASCYEPLLTGAAGYADVPSGTKFVNAERHEEFVGSSPNLEHVVLASEAALTPAATSQEKELYEWSADAPATERLQLLSNLPESEGGGPVAEGAPYLGNVESPDAGGWRPISEDGSRVFWTGESLDGESESRRLYMRDTAKGETKGETIRLDVQQPGAPSGGTPGAIFQAANAKGSKAFFTDSQPLTAQSGKQGYDLYECEIVEESGKDACKLTDLTPEGNGEAAEVQHILPGTSEDGSYVYFVANGVLAEGAKPGNCKEVSQKASTTCNLYVAHEEGGKWTTTFIATISGTDELDFGGEIPTFHNIGLLTARVSPNGRYLAFMSGRSLTGYDNRDALTGDPDEEVYLYDAATSRLVCASCEPTDARPTGVQVREFKESSGGTHTENIADVNEGSGAGAYSEETGIAANLPAPDVEGYGRSLYQPRYLSDSGRLFFNTIDALVPQDVNGQEDVYEYEPPVGAGGGTQSGSCTTASATYSERPGGCVDLISSGTSHAESGFLDASESGGDVFFLTEEKLAPQGSTNVLAVYDAHECTTQAPCVSAAASPPACATAEACRAAPEPQPAIFGAPPSATFTGAGNLAAAPTTTTVKPSPKKTIAQARAEKLAKALKACKKQARERRKGCEAAARKKYGAKPKAKQKSKAKAKQSNGRGS